MPPPAAAPAEQAPVAVKPEARVAPRPEPKADGKAEVKPEIKAKPESKPEAKPPVKADAKPDARAGAFHLQVGAFASEKAANEQADRVRKVGGKAYTERIKTQQGERIRVRVGPFATREAAEQARNRLRAAGVEVSVVAY